MTIWDFSKRLTRRLLIWSALSVLFSVLTFFSADLFLRGLCIQFFAWGVIDGAIAIFGEKFSAKKKLKMQDSASTENEAKESRWLSHVLWVNTGLDVLYILGGVWLMGAWGAESLLWKGHGAGVVI